MTNTGPLQIFVSGEQLETVEKFVYLGRLSLVTGAVKVN